MEVLRDFSIRHTKPPVVEPVYGQPLSTWHSLMQYVPAAIVLGNIELSPLTFVRVFFLKTDFSFSHRCCTKIWGTCLPLCQGTWTQQPCKESCSSSKYRKQSLNVSICEEAESDNNDT